MDEVIIQDRVSDKILMVRGKRVLLDRDLAMLYGVETKLLKRAVNRNIGRFPADFMFELTKEEYRFLRCQFGTLERGGHAKYLPYVFTEQGVAMLSGVLNSERAIQVNIAIMRAFVKLREVLTTHKGLAEKLGLLEKKVGSHGKMIHEIIQTIQEMIETPLPVEDPPKKKGRIGFH